MSWKDATLGQLLSLQRGYDLPSDNRIYGEIPIIGSAGITGFHNEAKVFGGGVTVGRSGNSFGKVFRCKEDFWPHNASLYVKENFGNDIDYIYYFLKNIDFTNYNSGSAQPSLNRNFIYPIKIEIPSLETQKRIASILSTYDDLIENNLKRIKLLEETAQNIYKEWFVNFRFPNYEHTEFDAESGLPVGWEMKKLSELNTKITDGTHDSPKPTENGFPLITGKNLIDGFVDFSNSYFISQEDHEKIKSRSYLDIGDIMYSNIGTVGSTAIVSENFEYSCKNVIIFKPLTEHTNFLYCFLTNDMNKKLFLQGLLGSNQKFISLKYAREYKFGFPNSDLILDFGLKTKSIFENRRCLFEMNQKLKEARDILLPRLMNRTIEV